MTLLLGAVADDFTGATDLAGTLVKSGLRTVQMNGLPKPGEPLPDDVEAIVVALKSRTAPVADAVRESAAAADWLLAGGAKQIVFKYCSTFDSTAHGNIGPVIEALMDRLGATTAIACPAFPATGRTVYQGHLFVFGQLLSESPMKDHPLTPMRDADLVRFLGKQTTRGVGLVSFADVEQGAEAIRARLDALAGEDKPIAIVDALTETHLRAIGHAARGVKLVTGASGVGMGLADNFREDGIDLPDPHAGVPHVAGHEAVVSGSCSAATLGQLAHLEDRYPVFRIDPLALAEGRDQAAEALDWAAGKLGGPPVVVAASAAPEAVQAAQARIGRMEAGVLVEAALSRVARGLVEAGVRRLVVAGGETSGAVVQELGLAALRIGPEIAPGVPACVALAEPPLAVALKSGNFGGENFFVRAFEVMP